MFLLLLALFIVLPIVELALLFKIAEIFRAGPTIVLVIITGAIGSLLARSQGFRTWSRIQAELRQGQMPGASLMDAVMIFVAGALLITPGVLTDLFGFSLLIPPCRRLYQAALIRWFRSRFTIRTAGDPPGQFGKTEIIDSYVVEHDEEQK